MSITISQVFEDAQTSILCLGGAIAGSAADAIGTRIIALSGVKTWDGGLGGVGLDFVVRAVVSAALFDVSAALMPETSGNILFSIIFFAANQTLIRDAVQIGSIATGFLQNTTRTLIPTRNLSPPQKSAAASSCACSGY